MAAIAVIGLSGQMLGCLPVDAHGRPLYAALIHADARAVAQASQIGQAIGAQTLYERTGNILDARSGLAKLLWLKESEPEVYRQMACFLDVNGYLIHRATGRQVMEWSGASAIGFDLQKKDWLRGVIRHIGLDQTKFPPLVRSIDPVGGLTAKAARECGLRPGTPVFGGGGDAQGAAVGCGAMGEGDGHIYLGTSGWVGVVTHKTPTGRPGVVSMQSADPQQELLFAEMETAGACLK